jgi:D-tyrosyl-tRNA(Tyr) deacylase
VIGLIQRVSRASVGVGGETVAAIERGILVLVGVERDDGAAEAARLAERLLAYRLFGDAAGRMNLSVRDIEGEVLLVPQFTLAADTERGNRASFSKAAPAQSGAALFAELARQGRRLGLEPAVGRFGADMQVELINDGPVTFWLRVAPK